MGWWASGVVALAIIAVAATVALRTALIPSRQPPPARLTAPFPGSSAPSLESAARHLAQVLRYRTVAPRGAMWFSVSVSRWRRSVAKELTGSSSSAVR